MGYHYIPQPIICRLLSYTLVLACNIFLTVFHRILVAEWVFSLRSPLPSLLRSTPAPLASLPSSSPRPLTLLSLSFFFHILKLQKLHLLSKTRSSSMSCQRFPYFTSSRIRPHLFIHKFLCLYNQHILIKCLPLATLTDLLSWVYWLLRIKISFHRLCPH